ncbi:ribosomal large subunit pseudouridine synthase B [gut metagenome]|uniref:Ribosomal large subunit pseudouridine synthase B n=1 Tax=gut metagenome TaxID=749906 RepID=J9G4X9_9ZZZZ
MTTENETWRDASSSEENAAGRDGNQFAGGYNRPAYQRENGERPRRPRFNSENGERSQRAYSSDHSYRPQRAYSNDRSYRPQRTYNNDRSYRPRFNNENGERPQRSYAQRYNAEGGDRPQRSFNTNERSFGSDRSYRPRYSEGGDRPQYSSYGSDRSQRPRFNQGGPRQGGFSNRDGYSRPRRMADYDPNAKYSKKKQIEYKEQFVDPNEPIRLNKFLANAGVCSRREADEFITAGVVSVNGEVVTELGTKIKRGDEVKFHDQIVSIERKIYVLLNKPKDTVTTSDDPQSRRTVMDLVKDACTERIYPVGRLDRNTTGVLLLTNDGDLASKLTHPKYLKKKVYHVHLDKNLTKADMEQIAAGIQLDDGEIHADAISYTDEVKKNDVGIEIHSGKNRIVRRIFESLGYKVVKLDRVYFAGLTKKGLRRGEWRYLTENEVNFLRMGSFE